MKVDKNKKYYKVVDENGHFGLKYKLGLNIDPLPFNANKDDECVKGGIYFSDLDNIFHYFHYGDYVAEVEIPADAKVCADDNWDKARADKIIINKMMSKKDFISWLIDDNQLNWKEHSWAVSEYCPEKINPEKFNWEHDSWAVAEFCPHKLDPEKFNWEGYSSYVAKYCPHKLDTEKFNWEEDSSYVAEYCPDKLDPEKYNWQDDWYFVDKYCPDKMKLRPKNKGGDNESRQE